MDGEEILIFSGSDSSEIDIISLSSDEAETNEKSGAGNPNPCRPKIRPNQRHKNIVQNGISSKTDNDVIPVASTSNDTMTCIRKKTLFPSESLRQKHSYKNKTWSQVKKEKEERKCLPPACKRARLNLPEVSQRCTNKFSRSIEISDDEDDFSDELPDLDQRQKTPEYQPAYSVPPVNESPIVLSSDDDTTNPRPGLFASLSFTGEENGTTKDDASSAQAAGGSSDKKQSKSLEKQLLLTKTAKDKMAQVIGKFLKSKNGLDGEARPNSPSELSDISSSSSKRSSLGRRHFLDAIWEPNEPPRPQSPVPSLSDVSDSSQIVLDDCEIDDSDDENDENNDSDDENSDSEEDDDYRPPDSECSETESMTDRVSVDTEISTPKKPRLVNVTKTSMTNSQHTGLKKYFQTKPNPFENVNMEGRCTNNLVSYQTQFVTEADELSAALTHLHVNTIDAVFEEGEKFLEYGMALVTDFSSRLKPTESIVRQIIEKSLLSNSSISVSYKAFKLLNAVWQKYPSSIFIDWDVFSQVLGNLSVEKGLYVSPTETVVKGSLFLQLVVQALETDLQRRNLHNLTQIRKTLAYRYLSVDTAYANLKQIVYWVGSIITSEFKNVTKPRREDVAAQDQKDQSQQWSQIGAGYVPKVLPNLQKLLHFGIQVSRNCVDAAKRVSSELVRNYIYLSDIRQKKLLLQTVSSDLLRFKVTQKILEEYCDGTSLCCEDFPVSLKQVVDAYYLASPPRSLVTPPQSPSDDENVGAAVPRHHQYSTSSCEELAMLIYNNTQSYLQCAHTAEYEPLAQQSGKKPKDFSFICERDLQVLHEAVDDLHGHMLQLSVELNSGTHTYLFMMQCLSNLH